MRWRQFLTPVESFNSEETRDYMASHEPSAYCILDVRQPSEYEAGHIPGAALMPLPELDARISEIDTEKPVIVYGAVGGRSRMAAQMLSGIGFKEAINMAGGFKAWECRSGFSDEQAEIQLFTGDISSREALMVAYSLEAGLEDFYTIMVSRLDHAAAITLFEHLAKIEAEHRMRIISEYRNITNEPLECAEFEKKVADCVAEGGMSTDEYVNLFRPDWNHLTDIVDVAMSIEAQAYDLYKRTACKHSGTPCGDSFQKIADEEKSHMVQIGKLVDNAR